MTKVLVVNGPNLNLLGKRETEIYGSQTLKNMNEKLSALARDLKIDLQFFQSNSEGDIIDFIHKTASEADGIIINPGALSHTSYSLRDAIAAAGIETVEVHISNIYGREDFRQKSVIAPVCSGHLVGFGFYGYAMALSYFSDMSREEGAK